MKSLSSLCYAALLILLLAISTMAGEISCPGLAGPPPSVTGQIPIGDRSPGDMDTPIMSTGEMQAGTTASGQIDCPRLTLLLTFTWGVL
jgi:hypothetical protein